MKQSMGVSLLRALSFALLFCGLPAFAITLTGTINSHDPGTITKDGGTYFHFTTGQRIWYSTSTNLTAWTAGPSTVFANGWPTWINTAVPGFAGEFWAPDVIKLGSYYYLYYSVSTFGSSKSAIGVARSTSLVSPSWTDLGAVIQSDGSSTTINAIDPALFKDNDGRVYMSYGSWFGGIGLTEIDTNTGKAMGSVTKIYGTTTGESLEAPYITRDGNYYYLFVNRGNCCQGSNSTYYIQVARSTNIFGPYTNEQAFIPNLSDTKYKGPGHVGLLKENGCNYVSTHYYDLNDAGNPKLDIVKMTYVNGWPTYTRNFTFGGTCTTASSSSSAAVSSRSSSSSVISAASSSRSSSIIASSSRSSSSSAAGGSELLSCNSGCITFNQAGSGNIEVRARSTSGNGTLSLLVNGTQATNWGLSSTYSSFYYGTGTFNSVKVCRNNGGATLQVDYVKYNNITYQAENFPNSCNP